ncbi:MAG: hypothetical protein J1E34_05160 [Oscillospiraceae bacterium]|nr:hypothetical protein [Oscillospiraceae bacterium]
MVQTFLTECSDTNAEIKRITEILENEDFSFTEYDDLIVRRIVECIRLMSDKSIVIILKGVFEIIKTI